MRENMKENQKQYWRSLDELADTPEFRKIVEREFPEGASELKSPVTRRNFLGLMGASIAFAGLASCRRPVEKIVPFVKAPENMIPGVPKYYATTITHGRHALGVLVESHEGRPTKIEGNPEHPESLGKTNIFHQADVLNLYDPDRAKDVSKDGVQSNWSAFVAFWKEQHASFSQEKGKGLAVLSGEFASPSLKRLYNQFKKEMPLATWHVNEPVSEMNIHRGLKTATGKNVQAYPYFDKARVILSIDHDFLGVSPDNVSANRGFAEGRRMEDENGEMNRLYMVETSFSVTGGMADHRKRLTQGGLELFTRQLAHALGVIDDGAKAVDAGWMEAVVKDLKKNRGASLVVAGQRQSAATHALVFAINEALGNNGATVDYFDNPDVAVQTESIKTLTDAMKAGEVKTLVILDQNPVYTASSADFAKALASVENVIALSPYWDETGHKANWHVPMSHFLESWGDASDVRGNRSVVQPLIAPLYNTVSMTAFVNLMVTGEDVKDSDVVKATWNAKSDDKDWRRILYKGVAAGNLKPAKVKSRSADIAGLVSATAVSASEPTLSAMDVVILPSASLYDGRYSNNGWLMEVPDPVTHISWDNAALMSTATAEKLGVQNEDLITLNAGGRELEIVVSVLPGVAENVIALELGYGRQKLGRIGNGSGFDVYSFMNAPDSYALHGVKVNKTGRTYPLANTQDHNSMEGRPIILEADLDEYRKEPEFAKEAVKHPPLVSLWDEKKYDHGYQWGMAIDLSTCSGCNTCVVACQAENNIPIIGKEEVKKGREMHWIRLDRYFKGDPDNPEMLFQPMGCQHCENAPCEQVCPVQATLHDDEGLNVMTYNRCVGTRYCANNCPYKVRRFNFFNFTNSYPETIKMVQNPDVTVRFRGVMEKCTYCTQRIQEAKINAKNEARLVADGEIQTACQQACPADSIVFGNILDPESRVAKLKKQNREYKLLVELNIKPRTSFLARIKNPNPEMETVA